MKLNTHFAIALFLLISSACQAQTATGQSSEFIPGDENYTLMLAFHRTDTILVVTPDGFDLDSADRELIEAFPFWGGHQKIPHYRYLNEKDLEPHDYTKRIQYYGPFFMFRELSVSALFRHEAAHSLIEQVAGHNPYCFFSEGFAVSTEYFFTPGSFKNDRNVARENTSLLSEEMVYSTTGRFYNNPASYQVSGAFTRYLVDRLGMEKFIRAYGDNKIEEALKEETGLDIAQTIKSFMQSLEEGED